MKHAVITGGMGFIGHHLWKHLAHHQWRVDVLDSLQFVSNNLRVARHKHTMLSLWHRAAADNFDLLSKLVDPEHTVIFHLASHPNQRAVAADPENAEDNIVGLTSRLADYCKIQKLRMVYISSSMVYGNWVNSKAVETQLLSPTNLYGQYKMRAEEIVRSTLPNKHMIIRPSAVYGARDSADRVVSRWIASAVRGEPINVDDPDSLLDFTYVRDLIEGIALAGQATVTGTVNITGGDPRTLLEAANIINNAFGNRSEIIIGKGLPSDQPRRGALDISLACHDLGWKPQVDFVQGIAYCIRNNCSG
jgi:nucleoside-diphosphate-sugar epimerase